MSKENNIKIEFNPSAFKHGCTEDDVYKAIDTFCYDGDVILFDKLSHMNRPKPLTKWTEGSKSGQFFKYYVIFTSFRT